MTNPEKPVMDDIDELIASELDQYGVPLDDYSQDRYVKCELCHGNWHGLPRRGCPGAYATPQQLQAWCDEHSKSIATLDVPIGQDYRFNAVCISEDGRAVYGTLTLASRDGAAEARFIPHDEQRQGLECDLYTFDEAERISFHPYSYVPQEDSGNVAP